MQLRQARASAPLRASRSRAVVVRAAKSANGPRLAIVGVTGAVGQEFLQVRRAACAAAARCSARSARPGARMTPPPHRRRQQ